MNVAGSLVDVLESASDRFGGLDGRFLLAALVLQLGTLAFRSFAWRGVIAAAYPGRQVRVLSVAGAYAAGVAMNAFTPARGGELARVLIARTQIAGSTVPTLAASLAVVTLVDGLIGSVLLGVLWATGVSRFCPRFRERSRWGSAGGLGLAVAAAGRGLAFRLRPEPMRRLARRAAQGLLIMRQPGRYACTVLPFQVVACARRIGVVWLVLAAFGIRTSLATAALVVVLNGASTLVPVPGGAGTQQVLATFALQGAVSTGGCRSRSRSGCRYCVTGVNVAAGIGRADGAVPDRASGRRRPERPCARRAARRAAPVAPPHREADPTCSLARVK